MTLLQLFANIICSHRQFGLEVNRGYSVRNHRSRSTLRMGSLDRLLQLAHEAKQKDRCTCVQCPPRTLPHGHGLNDHFQDHHDKLTHHERQRAPRPLPETVWGIF